MSFAVCSRKGDTEMIYNVATDETRAFVNLGKLVMFRVFGEIPREKLWGVVNKLHDLADNKDLDKGVAVAGYTFYVRRLSDEEALSFLEDDNVIVDALHDDRYTG